MAKKKKKLGKKKSKAPMSAQHKGALVVYQGGAAQYIVSAENEEVFIAEMAKVNIDLLDADAYGRDVVESGVVEVHKQLPRLEW